MKEWILLYLATLSLLLQASNSLDMRERAEVSPVIIRNGTDDPVVLDCNYNYDHYEASGLTVKWFWYRDHEPVYQWIPGGVPEVRGILKGKVNVSYLASEDKYSAHRALQILKPTSELSGKYTCTVSSYYDEKKQTVELLVYAATKFLELKFLKDNLATVNTTCSAHRLFPRPKMILYTRTQTEKYEIQNINIKIVKHTRSDGKVDTWDEPVTWEEWGEGIDKSNKKNKKRSIKKKKRNIRQALSNISTDNTLLNTVKPHSKRMKKVSREYHSGSSKISSRHNRNRRENSNKKYAIQNSGVRITKSENLPGLDFFNSDDTEPFGWYSIYADVVLTDSNLHEDGQLLECEVLLPGTTYSERTNVVYFPGHDAMELYAQESTSMSEKSHQIDSILIFTLLVSVVL